MANIDITTCEYMPLVSVVVITYNSAQYVLETLDSVKAQTYQNIELIISDDGSQDETIEIVRNWLNEHKSCFKHSEIITVNENTGIPANCNRGVRAAEGEWVKIIAGDDILHTRCIDIYMKHATKFPADDILFSNMVRFIPTSTLSMGMLVKPLYCEIWNKCSVERQYNLVATAFIGNAPTFFVKSKIYERIKYDEGIRFMEDYPFILNALKENFRVVYVESTTVYYRFGDSSSNSSRFLFNDFYVKEELFRQQYIYPEVTQGVKYYYKYEYYRKRLVQKVGLNRKHLLGRMFNKILSLANPFSLCIKKHL